ncbi:high mobility group protein B1-like [Coccinella septempunctata]|uniref:high mobility group protein B1-like n=1 Tax=Coccinella septempunctata TaxID=41139 RepID=UPI001D0929A0|nr:high mobility group protein B1-like [Coccinella septempunctata]
MMSDESENDGIFEDNNEHDVYYKKYKLLLEECAEIQKANEILVFRIQEVNKIVKKRHKEVQFFKKRLLQHYGEDWSVIPNTDLVKEEPHGSKSNVVVKTEKIKEEKFDDYEEKPEKTRNRRPVKRKTLKTEKDPNAPKRPSNPFFQFCQEQRPILMEELNSNLKPGEVEPSKQELTRQLAVRWKTLSVNDKRVYVDMYEKSKEKYAAEMSEYKMKN